jgi:hypothetical protein
MQHLCDFKKVAHRTCKTVQADDGEDVTGLDVGQ